MGMSALATGSAPSLLALLLLCNAAATTRAYMDCGSVKLCGVLTLETGLGSDTYEHDHAVIHGLWPQMGTWGTSACVAPSSRSDIPYPAEYKEVLCYDQDKNRTPSQSEVGFANYEWEAHGWCAGLKDVQDFINQACGMAIEPMKVMDVARANGGSGVDVYDVADALRDAGYPVHYVNGAPEKQELQLSACADPSGKWKVAAVKDFSKVCSKSSSSSPAPSGGSSGPSLSSPSPPASSGGGSGAGECVAMQRGPACDGDSDCVGISGCARCAGSGFCTDVPLDSSPPACVPMQKGPACSGDSDCAALNGCVRCAGSGYCTDVPLNNGPSTPFTAVSVVDSSSARTAPSRLCKALQTGLLAIAAVALGNAAL